VARRVRRHADFLADLEEQVGWLAQNRDARWILRLRAAIDEATRAVTRFPAMGSSVDPGDPEAEATKLLRKLVLRGVPFVMWYAVAEDDVWLLRLFHARQKRPHAKRRSRRTRR